MYVKWNDYVTMKMFWFLSVYFCWSVFISAGQCRFTLVRLNYEHVVTTKHLNIKVKMLSGRVYDYQSDNKYFVNLLINTAVVCSISSNRRTFVRLASGAVLVSPCQSNRLLLVATYC